MKYIIIISLFIGCGSQRGAHKPVIYTSEQACAMEEQLRWDSAEWYSNKIDALIAQKKYDSVKIYVARSKIACGPTEKEYRDFMSRYMTKKYGNGTVQTTEK